MNKKKICFIASTGIPTFHKTNIEKLSEDFDVYAVMKFDDPSVFDGVNVKETKSIDIERRPSILKDLKALWNLYKYLHSNKFDAFISQASKPSLLAAIAGRMAGIPVRIRIFTGQIWANKTGFGRTFFKTIDKITVALNSHLLVDGNPQRKYLIGNGILKEGQATVLANGSICGVDVEKFKPDAYERAKLRGQFGINDDDVVFAFMGRLKRDKGVYELLKAFDVLASKYDNAKLVLIGNSEGIDENSMQGYPNIKIGENLILYGFTKEPYKTLNIADVFCLPSYREGFGMSVIEAAAVGLPVICSDAYGLADSFVDGETGLKCKVQDVESLKDAMDQYLLNPDIISEYGMKGRKRVVDEFNKELVSQAWSDYLKDLTNG